MAYNLDTLRNKRGVIPPAAMKMNGKEPVETETKFVLDDPDFTGNKNFDTKLDPNLLTPSKKTLRKVKRDRIKFYRELKKGGYITKEQFKEAKKEIKKYTDY
jgi:hypothetical protein